MLAMLTHMRQVPHRHFRMPGTVRTHTTVYTVVFAMTLTALFDLRRIAALGAIYYLIMDLAIHWGLLRHMKGRVPFNPMVVWSAIVLDVVVLGAFLWSKGTSDPLSLYVAAAGIAASVVGERLFLRTVDPSD